MRVAETPTNSVFNEDRDMMPSHSDEALSRALHVFDRQWHGIRSATACLPGGKLGITHTAELTGEDYRHIEGLIYRHRFEAVCFQGYSDAADRLVEILNRNFGQELRIYAVTHVTTSQFEHTFEMAMLRKIYDRLRQGYLRRVGSVKPNFHLFHPGTWPECIINIPPDISRLVIPLPARDPGTVFIPVENTWRKNLYTQVIAAHESKLVNHVLMVNWPSKLDQLMRLPKNQVVGFKQLDGLLATMAISSLVLNGSFSECQPMTQLEAVAVGRPTITGPLRLPVFSDHPLSRLCEITELDDPGLFRRRIDAILQEWRNNGRGMSEMIADFSRLRTAAGLARYKEFLEIAG